MPRLIDRIRTPIDTQTRQERAGRYRQRRLGAWVDPYPNILGTLPEKMVYAALSEQRIPFVYQAWHRAVLPSFGFDKWYRPDFLIPGAKIILEVQGFYWHSQPDQIESDAFKFAVFQQLGYKILAWWDFDIQSRLLELIAMEPDLVALRNTGPRVFTGHEVEIDDSKGIRTSNQARTNYGKRQAVYKTPKSKGGLYSYATSI